MERLRWCNIETSRKGSFNRKLFIKIAGTGTLLFLTLKTLTQYQNIHIVGSVNDRGFLSSHRLTWRGWNTVEKLFIFGDSWSDSGFDVNGRQPSADQPMGNPPFPGRVYEKGTHWPVYLTMDYNDSAVETFCFAHSGAAVDRFLVRNEARDLVEQVREDFVDNYVDDGILTWRADKSLFAIFIGINDNNILKDWENAGAIQIEVLEVYFESLDLLYHVGARNFLIMNVPPLGRTPKGDLKVAEMVARWNSYLSDQLVEFRDAHPGVTILEFDTLAFHNRVMDAPTTFPETAAYKDTAEYCEAYAGKDLDLNDFAGECSYSVAEYLWYDGLHTTSPYHQALASQVAMFLKGDGTYTVIPHD